MAWVVHIYEMAAAPGDDAFVTQALSGPFASLEDAQHALMAAGWRAYEPTHWESPRRPLVAAHLAQTTELPRA